MPNNPDPLMGLGLHNRKMQEAARVVEPGTEPYNPDSPMVYRNKRNLRARLERHGEAWPGEFPSTDGNVVAGLVLAIHAVPRVHP